MNYSESTDTELVKLVQESKNNDALEALIDRHSGIYMDMVRKFGSKNLSMTQIDDIVEDKDYIIYQAALEYDETKAKFSTYLANKTKFMCLTRQTNNKKLSKFVAFDKVDYDRSVSSEETPQEKCISNESYERIMNLINKHHDERVRTIFQQRYFLGRNGKLKPWNQIAQIVQLSTQGCINIHNKIIKDFKKVINDEQIKF